MKYSGSLLLATGLAFGYLVGGHFAPQDIRPTEPPDSVTRAAAPIHSVPDAAERLAALVKLVHPGREGEISFQGMRDIAAYVDSLTPEQIPDIVRQFGNDPDLKPILSSLEERWAREDPDAALAWARKSGNDDPILSVAFATLTDLDPASAIREARQFSARRGFALQSVEEQLAARDPAQALALAHATGTYWSAELTCSIFQQWTVRDLNQATQAMLKLGPDFEGLTAAAAIDRTLLGQDPGAAVDWLNRLPASVHDDVEIQMADDWAGIDPQAAEAWVESLPPSRTRNSALLKVMSALAQVDPKTAVALTAGLPPSFERNQEAMRVVAIWSQHDLKGAEAYISSLPAGAQKNEMISGIIRNELDVDIKSTLDLINQMVPNQNMMGSVKDDALNSLVNVWVKQDLDAALAYGQALPPGKGRSNFFTSIADEKFDRNPAAAIAWLKSLPNDDRQSALADVAGSWVLLEPSDAMAFALSLPPGKGGRDILVSEVAQHMATKDPNQALTWLGQLPDEDSRPWLVQNILSDWSKKEPLPAARYLQSMPDSEARQKSLSAVTENWIANDPTAAAQWAATLPDGPLKDQACGAMAQMWEKADPTPVSNWLNQLPQGSARDSALKSISEEISGYEADPAKAIKWAESIGDPTVRQAEVKAVLEEWIGRGQSGAAEAIQASSLPDDVKQQLLHPPKTDDNGSN